MSSQGLLTPTSSNSQPFLLPDLPLEIITEILSRLPVKSLIRFMSVSKSWLYLIKDPKFINTHLIRSSDINNYTHLRLILRHCCNEQGQDSFFGNRELDQDVYYINSVSLHSIFSLSSDNSSSIHALELDYPLKDPCQRVSIVGCCNGLVCVVINEDTFFIWNPTTRESKKLPDSGMALSTDWRSTTLGFGYDKLNNDYKVLLMVYDSVWGSIENKVMVYSLRNNSWGKVRDFPWTSYSKRAVLVNEVLHWEVYAKSSLVSPIILSYDLGNETYGEIAWPNHDEFSDYGWDLSVLKGCLCICNKFDAWLMKEYGIRDSWTKLCAIGGGLMKEYTTFPKYWRGFSLLYMFMKGEILLGFVEDLILYDINSGKFKIYELLNLSDYLFDFEATTYVESLVSPHIYDDVRVHNINPW